MVPGWMIEEMEKREEEWLRREDAARPRLELPLPPPPAPREQNEAPVGGNVITIQIWGGDND